LSEIEGIITSNIQEKYPERKKRVSDIEIAPSLLGTFKAEVQILDFDTFMKNLQGDINIEYVEINGEGKISSIPTDTYFSSQWGLHNNGQWGGVVDTDIDAPEAWDTTVGIGNIKIGVVDSGVDYNHDEFNGRISGGWDFINDDGDPMDDNGHGTRVAGIIAARGNNGIGVAGVCWECSILPVKATNQDGIGEFASFAEAIVYATDIGADIINISIEHSYSLTVENAVNEAYSRGVVIIASRGNVDYADPEDPKDPTYIKYPAGYTNVIAVGAHNYCNERKERYNCEQNDTWESRYGNGLDFLAPGVHIYTTTIGWYTEYFNGTSASTAFASGIAGLILSINDTLSPDGVRLIMQTSTDDMNTSGYDPETGFGRINANNALESVCSAVPADCARLEYEEHGISEIEGNGNGLMEPGESIRIEVTLQNHGYKVYNVIGNLSTSSGSIENIIAPYNGYFTPLGINHDATATAIFEFDVREDAGFGDVDFTVDLYIEEAFVESFFITEVIENEIIHIVREDRAEELGKNIRHIKYHSHEEITWMNACMGVFPEGRICAQVLVPGYIIILRDNQTGWRYEYHTDLTEHFVYARAMAPSSTTRTSSNFASFSASILVRFAVLMKNKL
jgi:hypothetical protein